MAFPTDDAKLSEVDKVVANMTFEEPLKEIRGQLVEVTQDRFDKEMAPDGYKWEPRKRKSRRSRKILQKSLELIQSLHFGAVEKITEDSLEWGTNVKYAHFHMEGTKDFKGSTTYDGGEGRGMVKREFVGVTDEDADRMAEAVAEHAVKKILEAFDD